jgi:protein-L-isoaspartate O-methyltransferase
MIHYQVFVKVTKQLDGTMSSRTLSHVRYVPLTPGLKV